jgi:uncharacterized protein
LEGDIGKVRGREMKENIVEEIRKFVEEECKKTTSKHSGIFENHLVPMRNLALELGKKVGADLEIVEISAWLHDIGGVIVGRKDHHITGAKIAEEKLKELGYPQEKISSVKHCILAHRSSQDIKPETIEAQVILEADSMSNFDNLPGIFKVAYIDEGLTQPEARKSAREKLERKWKKLQLPESKILIKPKYEAAMLLLK